MQKQEKIEIIKQVIFKKLDNKKITATLEKEILSLIVNANIVKNPKQFFKELKKELNLKRGTEND